MDLDRDARRILDLAAGASSPEPEDKARIEKKLAAVLGASALATTGTAATTAAATSTTASATQTASAASSGATVATSGALKWWIGAALIAASITGYVALSKPAPTPAKTAPAPAPAAPVVTAPPAPAPAPAASLEPEQVQEPEPIAPARSRAPRKPAEQTLDQELELLHRAQAAWRARQATSALSLLDEHESRFPRSQLRLERDSLRVLTLCELGNKPEAAALARKLIERAPRSPLRKTIEESCALK